LSGQDPALVGRMAQGVAGEPRNGITDPGFNPNAAAQRATYGGPAGSGTPGSAWMRDDQGQPVFLGGGGTPRPGAPALGSTDPRLTAYGGPSGTAAGAEPRNGITDPGFNPNAAAQRGGGGYGITDPGWSAPSADERYKQIAQIAKASPPSPYDGLDDQDAATLR